jgi:N-acyl-phosphatidylethanolamine-hydrolysing phospholipase D
VGHSTFLLQLGGWNVLTDPVWGARASPVPFAGPARYTPPGVAFDALPPVDLVVLSHDHYDHLDAPTVRRLVARFPAAHWLAPLAAGAVLRALGARAVTECDWWGRATFASPPATAPATAPAAAPAAGDAAGGDVPVSRPRSAAGALEALCVPAQHFSGRGVADRDASLWAGWVLRAPGAGARAAVYFAGDTGLHPDFAEVGRRGGPLALALLPVGAYAPRWFMRPVHCDPDDALAAYDALCAGIAAAHPDAAMPAFGATHFGTFKLTDEPIDEPPRRTRAAWGARHTAAALWVPRHGESWRTDV